MKVTWSAFFECISYLQSTLKVWNAFEVTYTHKPLLSSNAFGPFEVLWRSETHFKSLKHKLLLSSNAFLTFKLLWRAQMHSKWLAHTKLLLSLDAFHTFKVLRRYEMHPKNIWRISDKNANLLAVTLVMLSLCDTLVYKLPFMSRKNFLALHLKLYFLCLSISHLSLCGIFPLLK